MWFTDRTFKGFHSSLSLLLFRNPMSFTIIHTPMERCALSSLLSFKAFCRGNMRSKCAVALDCETFGEASGNTTLTTPNRLVLLLLQWSKHLCDRSRVKHFCHLVLVATSTILSKLCPYQLMQGWSQIICATIRTPLEYRSPSRFTGAQNVLCCGRILAS